MIVVIGGGPAGRYAAMRLAGAGREVMLVDRRPAGLGGQCLHQGCMVICALNDVARTYEHLEGLHQAGIVSGVPELNFPRLISRMQEIISTIARVIDTETREAGVRVVTDEACVSGGRVTIQGEEVEAESVIIATGSKPALPHILGDSLNGVYTAHSILSIGALPKHLVIIGGGAIATEMAYLFSVFGSSVTILARSTLLSSFPAPLVKEAKRDLHRTQIIEGASVTRITGNSTVSGVQFALNGEILTVGADAVLLATGMEPDTTTISGIPLSQEGYITVNERMETGIPGVYAVGDVTGNSWLTPLARRQGRIAADVILGIVPPAPLSAIPQAVKLRNDLAFCGETQGNEMSVMIPSPAGPGSFWSVMEHATGRTSLSVDPDSGMIRGMLEASPYASVVAAYHALLINTDTTIDQMEKFIEVHPSADGSGWTGRYLADRYARQKSENNDESGNILKNVSQAHE